MLSTGGNKKTILGELISQEGIKIISILGVINTIISKLLARKIIKERKQKYMDTEIEIKKIEDEYQRVKLEFNDNRLSIALDAANVFVLESSETISFIDYLEKVTSFKGAYSLYYMEPGERKTIKEFLMHALQCEIKRIIIYFWIRNLLTQEQIEKYSKKYDLDLSK